MRAYKGEKNISIQEIMKGTIKASCSYRLTDLLVSRRLALMDEANRQPALYKTMISKNCSYGSSSTSPIAKPVDIFRRSIRSMLILSYNSKNAMLT